MAFGMLYQSQKKGWEILCINVALIELYVY